MQASNAPQTDHNVDSNAFDRMEVPSPSTSFVASSCYFLTSHWKTLFLGQVLSFLLASAGATQASLHLDCGLSSPTFTMALIYLVLGVTHLVIVLCNQRQERRGVVVLAKSSTTHQYPFTLLGIILLQRPAWQYLIMAFLDVEANAVTMLSFRYTTLTSVTLFDALAIPSAMVISRIFLGRKYLWFHLFGVVICMTGVVFNVMQDYESDHSSTEDNDDPQNDNAYPHRLLGDFLAIAGGVLYGVNDVLTEATVRHNGGTTEYLGMMGIFAFTISLIQALLLEWQDILEFFGESDKHSSTCSLGKGWFLFFVFAVVTLMSYKGASMFLMMSEAAFFNLSLLTGDLWSIVFSVVAEKIIPRPLFFVALVFVMSGVVIYEMAPSPVLEDEKGLHEQLAQIHSDFDLPSGDDKGEGLNLELT